jgi:CelD/BcsL family acetyltransferase involved in cellulose biosynthesis
VTASQEWDDALHRLKFTFGEYCFYTARFEAVERTTHVSRLKSSLEENTACVIPLLKRHATVAIPAHPISADPGWLKITRDYLRYVPGVTVHYFIEPGSSFNEYLHQMPRKHRQELLRKRRRFVEHSGGEIDLRSYRSLPEARMFYPLACDISRKTYQHKLLDVGLPETASFEADQLNRAGRDAMRGYLLFHRGTAIAYACGTVMEDCLRFRCIGYDPAFRDLSPGIVLIYEALRSAIGEGCFATIDFGFGEAQYKRAFATGALRCATVFFFRPTARHLIMIAAHRACIAASDACAAIANRLGIKDRIKRHLRTRAVRAGRAGRSLWRRVENG